jgi:hypothetical protein
MKHRSNWHAAGKAVIAGSPAWVGRLSVPASRRRAAPECRPHPVSPRAPDSATALLALPVRDRGRQKRTFAKRTFATHCCLFLPPVLRQGVIAVDDAIACQRELNQQDGGGIDPPDGPAPGKSSRNQVSRSAPPARRARELALTRWRDHRTTLMPTQSACRRRDLARRARNPASDSPRAGKRLPSCLSSPGGTDPPPSPGPCECVVEIARPDGLQLPHDPSAWDSHLRRTRQAEAPTHLQQTSSQPIFFT